MRRHHRGVLGLLAGLLLLALAWAVSPATVPLYDGVGFPDEPYRFVDTAGRAQKTPPPGIGTGTVVVAHGSNADPFYVSSDEQGPQVAVYIPPHALSAPPSATKLTMRATPEAPDRQPPGGPIDGNVYRLTASAQPPGPVSMRPVATSAGNAESAGGITLRATTALQPGPVFVYRPAPTAPWRTLATTRVGNDIYRTEVIGLGDYALAWVTPASAGDGGGHTWAIVGGAAGAVIVLLAALAIGVRRHRRASP